MEYNTTHEQIIGGQRITTYISMTITPVEMASPCTDDTTEMPDANYVDALIEAAIYNHYPPVATPSEFKRVFARALLEYETFKDTPAEKAAMAAAYALAVKTPSAPKYDNALIVAEVVRHSPTIAMGAEFKAVYDKAVEIYDSLGSCGRTPIGKAEYAVKGAVTIVCPEKCQPTPAELISEVIAERWPVHLGLISTTNELKIAYRARAIFNEFAGGGRDKAVKAVEHAFKELVEDLSAKIDEVIAIEDKAKAKLIAEAIVSHPGHKNWTPLQKEKVRRLAFTNYPLYNFNSPVERATHAVIEAVITLGLSSK